MAKEKKVKEGFSFFGTVSGEELRTSACKHFNGKTITERASFNVCLQAVKSAEVNGVKVSKALVLGYLADGKNKLSATVEMPKATREGSKVKITQAIKLDGYAPMNYLSR
jgi:hypothetical protein